ncbi:hypothetical protein JCM18899A_34960 [Nocardioides sp. AN3]
MDPITSVAEHAFAVWTEAGPLPGRASTVGRLRVGPPTGDDAAAYDPYLHQHPGLRPVRFLSRLREAAYDGSRRGRCR